MFSTYTGNGAGQVNVVDMLTGNLIYMFNGTENLVFGDSRSSVAVDKEGCTCAGCLGCVCVVPPSTCYQWELPRTHRFRPPPPPPFHADLFVASESPLGETNVPVFWCLDITRLKPRWAVFAGASGDSISSSSPIVTTTFSGDPVILFGAENTVRD